MKLKNEKFLESITVGAIFELPASVKPAWFIWNGRKIKIVRTNHIWSERKGTAKLYHFSVTDGTDTYHLVMNSETQSWYLEEVNLSL